MAYTNQDDGVRRRRILSEGLLSEKPVFARSYTVASKFRMTVGEKQFQDQSRLLSCQT